MIGRVAEQKELNDLYDSGKAELVAIYGRRRVGKTYLVDEVFKDRITFRHAGLSPVETNKRGLLKKQLEHFYYSLKRYGMKTNKMPKSWLEGFYMLEMLLETTDQSKRLVLFFDELPWLDSPRSGFMTAFEAFWNNWACYRNNILVVVCGSANSWVLDKLINNHGGLYNRVTHVMKLNPFTLKQCEELFLNNGVKLSRYDIVQSYMVCGGIPYYLNYFKPGLSLAQNIDELYFSKTAKLDGEFERLFASIFERPDLARRIVEFLATKKQGYSWNDILEYLDIQKGVVLSTVMRALIASDFVEKYTPFGGDGRKSLYRLVDPFCMFYLQFVKTNTRKDDQYWQQHQSLQKIAVWRGIAFENVCYCHIEQIKNALSIAGVSVSVSPFATQDAKNGGIQIDMVLDRNDNIVDICEAKFYNDDFVVNQDYYRHLLKRESIIADKLGRRKTVHQVLITTFGLKKNSYSSVFTNVITLDELFAV